MKLESLWDEDKTRKLFKTHLILFLIGGVVATVYTLLLPTSTPYRLIMVGIPLIFTISCLVYFLTLKSNRVRIYFLIFTLESQLAAAIFMAITGGFLGIVQFAPYMFLLFTVFELGAQATVILGIFSIISFIGILIWSLTYNPSPNTLANFFYYTGSYALILIIERNIGKEISIQFEARRKLEQVDDLKNQFITLTSHYLRTPLTAIKVLTTELSQTPLAPVQKVDLNQINLAAGQLETLTEELLTISLIDRGQAKVIVRSNDLNQLLIRVVNNFKAISQYNQVTIKYQPPPNPLPVINFDADMLKKAISNIVENATLYNKVAGYVNISLSQNPTSAIIKVEDSGQGIDQEHLKTLFSPFNRGSMDKAIISSQPGIGLGLYISKLIVEAHHGSIKVESTLGKGSTFTIYLPLNLKATV